jgi:ribonuclease HI
VIVTPAQLLLAIAEHLSLTRACAALDIDLETARKLLRGAARALSTEKKAADSRASGAPHPPSPPGPPLPPGGARGGVAAGPIRIYSDGAARGNPGPAGAGAVLLDRQGHVLAQLGRFLGRQTNNVAEYHGLLLGLRRAQEMGAREIEVRADSQLMIRQLQGEYQVKHAMLKPLHAEAMRLLRTFARYDLQHIPREENKLADEMSNRAIDEEMQ